MIGGFTVIIDQVGGLTFNGRGTFGVQRDAVVTVAGRTVAEHATVCIAPGRGVIVAQETEKAWLITPYDAPNWVTTIDPLTGRATLDATLRDGRRSLAVSWAYPAPERADDGGPDG